MSKTGKGGATAAVTWTAVVDREYDLTMSLPYSRQWFSFFFSFIPALSLLALMTSDVLVGQSPRKHESREQSRSTEVRCMIRIDSPSWKQDGPALVHVTLENLTDRDLDLVIVPELYLRSGSAYTSMVDISGRGTYTSPVDIVHNKPLDVRRGPHGGIRPVPLKIHLGKGSSADFEVDAAKILWAREISSVWPSSSLRGIDAGRYSLQLEFADKIGNSVKSNKVAVSLEKGVSSRD